MLHLLYYSTHATTPPLTHIMTPLHHIHMQWCHSTGAPPLPQPKHNQIMLAYMVMLTPMHLAWPEKAYLWRERLSPWPLLCLFSHLVQQMASAHPSTVIPMLPFWAQKKAFAKAKQHTLDRSPKTTTTVNPVDNMHSRWLRPPPIWPTTNG